MRSAILAVFAFAAAVLAAPRDAARLAARAPTPVDAAPDAHWPQPSNHGWKKREQLPIMPITDVSRQLCPLSMSACPISAATPTTLSEWISNGFECVEFNEDLMSCGGCGTLDEQYDCTAIAGALGVSCEVGSCRVHSCTAGYSPALDGKTCVPTN